ncbi:hypothetical protein LSTR_LSTR011771, partial [Laodelphax striatellus]
VSRDTLCHNGTCEDFGNSHRCHCQDGYAGSYCAREVNECESAPCQNGATCQDLVGSYLCQCATGFQGQNCELNVDDCQPNPCQNGGTCHDQINKFSCSCPPGTLGIICEINVDDCMPGSCHNNGTCVDRVGGFECKCPPGFVGGRCEGDINECLSNPCGVQGTLDCVQLVNNYHCNCKPGYMGRHCEVKVNFCDSFPCQNGGQCEAKEAGHVCLCPPQYSGRNCEFFGHDCDSDPCQNGGICSRLTGGGYRCTCPPGTTGTHCELDSRDECASRPCQHGAYCQDRIGDYACYCPQSWSGKNCDVHDPSFQGTPVYDAYCKEHYANGHCDYGCNSAECNWDGLDCEPSEVAPNEEVAEGVIKVVILMNERMFRDNQISFLREMGHQLRSTVRIKSDRDGEQKIKPFRQTQGVEVFLELDNRRCAVSADAECFPSAQQAADFLAATAQTHKLSTSFPIHSISGISDDDLHPPAGATYVLIGVFLVTLVALLLGVLVTAQRKRAHGITWFPEGFLRHQSSQRRTSRRRGPDGQEMRNLNKNSSVSCLEGGGGVGGPLGQWSDDEELPPAAKKSRGDPSAASAASAASATTTDYEDMWSHQPHLDSRNVILTPPSMETVDVRGPCGMTPLMVAAVKGGGGLDEGVGIDEGVEDDSTVAVIADLVAQGAELNAQMDKTGETSLHLAARYARADAAKRLLDAGAEANAQDNTGRTPLHAAVAADAMGVFQILLRNRATNLNAKMHDGTTPLILAARLAIEGMVEDLINADADINAADNSGKAALHWAAAVNNVDAVNILLAHGANRDAQDDKDETPLFLAAREGSFEASKALLDHFANREITDHMDRLPRDVASERLHHDIVRLLDEHVPRSPQMVSVIPNGPLLGSPNHHHLITHPTVIGSGPGGKPGSKAKKRPKSGVGAQGAGGASPNSPDNETQQQLQQGNGNQLVRRKPSVKKSRKNAPSGVNCLEGATDLGLASGLSALDQPLGPGLYGNQQLPQPPAYEDCIKNTVSLHHQHQLGGLDPTYQYQPLAAFQAPGGFQEPSPPHSITMSPSPIKSRPSLPTSPTHMAAMRRAAATQQQQQQQQHAAAAGGNNVMQHFDFSDLPQAAATAYTSGNSQQQQQAASGVNQQNLAAAFQQQQQQQQQNVAAHQQQLNAAAAAHQQQQVAAHQQIQAAAAAAAQQQYYHYLTPPSDSLQGPESFSTPSPDSPWHWSSSSPHSNSDWSEGISSPNNNKHSDAIYI